MLRAQLRPRPLLVLVPPVRPPIHLQKRKRRRPSPRSRLVVSGKHLLRVSHLDKSHQRVRRRLRLRLLPSNSHNHLQLFHLYRHSHSALHLLPRLPLVKPRQLLRHPVPRLIGLDPSPLGHPLRRSQQRIRSHLGPAANLLPLLLPTVLFRLERPGTHHLHSVPRRMHRCLRWGLHHRPRKERVEDE